ncbi:MAG: hypothetical protein ACYDD1_03435 [Caulobacteraceae bacterium]
MRHRLILAGLMAALLPAAAIPAQALAQPADPNCVRSNHDTRVEGTVLGAVGGALIGGALGHGTGAVIGGLGGAGIGNALAGQHNDPCPSGYYRNPPPPPPGYGQGPGGPGYGAGPGYGPGPGDHGYGPGPGPANYGPGGGFWRGAPGDLRQRIDFMQSRLQEASQDGRLSRSQSRRAFRELGGIRTAIHDLYQRDNGLSPDDRAYIQARLDHLGASVHWMERTGY